MPRPDHHFRQDFFSALWGIGSFVLAGLGILLNVAAIFFLCVAALFLLFDESYVGLFRPWIIICGLYLVLSVTYMLYRPKPDQVVIVVENHHETHHLVNILQQVRPMPDGRLIAMGSGQPIDHGTRYQRSQILWLHTDEETQFAHMGHYSASVCQRDGAWLWQVAADGIIQAEGQARSEAEAKRNIETFLSMGSLPP